MLKVRPLWIFLFILICGGMISWASSGVAAEKFQVEKMPIATDFFSAPEFSLDAVEQAILQELASRQDTFVYMAFKTHITRVSVSTDGSFASAWMNLQDPVTGQDLPGEPGLALLQWVNGKWDVSLPGDAEWEDWLIAAPDQLIPADEKAFWLELNAESTALQPAAPISGYLLPWEGGKTAYLSGSVSHDAYIPSGNAHYAFDFYVPGTSSSIMFDVFAARAGTVWMFRDQQVNHSEESPGNYLVLKDTTTYPTTYQLYLHLAQGSIPANLKKIGVMVAQGQYIGTADDTGFSTGNHLHFQVHTEPNSYWGRSVDITFNDVAINGGRPRVKNNFYNDEIYCTWPGDVCNNFQSAYVSGNKKTDPIPPKGGFFGLSNDDVIRERSVVINGWAKDDESGLKSVQIVAAYAGSMYMVGPEFSYSPFTYTWDLCQAGVPDGPVSLGLRIFDNQVNQAYLTGLVTMTKSHHCTSPPPACSAGANQVALFSEPNYMGQCALFNIGSYPTLNLWTNQRVASVQVGQGVQATFYAEAQFGGRAETFVLNDSNLSDQRVGNVPVSSLMVNSKTQLPSIPQPVWPANKYNYTPGESLVLYWNNLGNATEFQARVTGANRITTSDWLSDVYWHLGTSLQSYDPGLYYWQVRARNSAGISDWSPSFEIYIPTSSGSAPQSANLPFFDGVENGINGWVSTGLWHREQDPSPIDAPDGSYYWWFGEQVNGNEYYFSEKSGSLTSPVFSLPIGEKYYLRFNYAYQTETNGRNWDQRWVQIKVGDDPFVNLYQLYGEQMTGSNFPVWLTSPLIDLTAYAGKQIQIRFYFDTIDPSFTKPDNDFEGWYIDDVQINTQGPPLCSDAFEPNDTSAQAYEVTYLDRTLINAQICPSGDVDIYTFQGSAGDYVAIDIDAQEMGSELDSVIAVLDQDGNSVLAENDDLDTALLDSTLGYRLPRDGRYFIRVKPWDYPAGGVDYYYRLSLVKDETPPVIQMLMPDGSVIGTQQVVIEATAMDQESDIEQVKFYWHSHDWNDPSWLFLGNGSRSGDLWRVTFDPSNKPEGKGGAFYALGIDQGGNVIGNGVWNLVIDKSPPVSLMSALTPVQSSTAFPLIWTAQDSLSRIHHFDLQVKIDDGSWQDLAIGLPGNVNYFWTVVEPDHLYAYRLRAVDVVGNTGVYPSTEESVTYVPAGAVLCEYPDSYESDNTVDQATQYLVDGLGQLHNFCNTQQEGIFGDDQDWIRIPVIAGEQFSALVMPQPNSGAFPALKLYTQSGGKLELLETSTPNGFGNPAWITYTPPLDGNLYLLIQSWDGNAYGTGTSYLVYIYSGPPRVLWLPILSR